MESVVLAGISIGLTVLAWLYMMIQDLRCVDTETSISFTDVKPSGKRIVYLFVMLVCLCGFSVYLPQMYKSNTLCDNAKRISLMSVLFVAANIDGRQTIIPNTLILSGLIMRVLFWCIELIADMQSFIAVFKNDMMACLIVLAFFVIGVLLVKGGLGMGDIKLMLVMCVFQGFYGAISSIFFSLCMVFVFSLILLIARKKTKKDSLPFAPSILLGTLLSIFLTGM